MIGTQDRWQEDLFVAGPLSQLIPNDHILKQIDKVLDLSWLRNEVTDTYSRTMGRPSIDPESANKLHDFFILLGICPNRYPSVHTRVSAAFYNRVDIRF